MAPCCSAQGTRAAGDLPPDDDRGECPPKTFTFTFTRHPEIKFNFHEIRDCIYALMSV